MDLIYSKSSKYRILDNTTTSPEKLHNVLPQSSKGGSHLSTDAETDQNDPQSPLYYSEGDYLMSFSLGFQRFRALASIDTGSSLTWVQCTPCIECYPQNQVLYNLNLSFYYEQVDCRTATCRLLVRPSVDITF